VTGISSPRPAGVSNGFKTKEPNITCPALSKIFENLFSCEFVNNGIEKFIAYGTNLIQLKVLYY